MTGKMSDTGIAHISSFWMLAIYEALRGCHILLQHSSFACLHVISLQVHRSPHSYEECKAAGGKKCSLLLLQAGNSSGIQGLINSRQEDLSCLAAEIDVFLVSTPQRLSMSSMITALVTTTLDAAGRVQDEQDEHNREGYISILPVNRRV